MRQEHYNRSDGDSVFVPVTDAIRDLLEMGYGKQELANRLGPHAFAPGLWNQEIVELSLHRFPLI